MFKSFGLLLVIAVIVGFCRMSSGQGIPSLKELERTATQEIRGANVPKADDAKKIALSAYAQKMKGEVLANEAPGSPSLQVLGIDVSGFGKKGDKVWEVRFSEMTPDGTRTLRAILWVHSDTSRVHYLIGPWQADKDKRE